MNQKGFFSIVLLLFFILLSLNAMQLNLNFSEKTKQSELILLEMEKTSFIRSQIEANFDFMVKETITKAAKKSLDPDYLKENVTNAISEFVFNTSEIHPNQVKFFLFKKEGLSKQEFSKEHLRDLLTVNVISHKKLFIAEFNFNGGEEKNIFFGSQIVSENFSQYFLITSGYSQKIFGLAAG